MQKKFKILKPQYFDLFHCVGGSSCQNNCCRRDWHVDVDKKTYERLKSVKDSNWQQIFKQFIHLNKNPQDQEDDYARIKIDNDSCPFLDNNNYCIIERNFGKIYTPLVCQTYPKIYNIINGLPEKSLALSCPEAARIVLLNPEPIKFYETEEEFYIFNIISNILDTSHIDIPGEPQHYFLELRVFIIALLQNRQYALWERLVILGFFFDALKELGKSSILLFISDYSQKIIKQAFNSVLINIPNQIIIEVILIKKLLTMPTNSFGAYFAERRAKALWIFSSIDKINLDEVEISLRYAKTYYDYYLPLVNPNSYILENYLVNYVFTTLFPFNQDKNIFENYIYLAIHYSLAKILLVGTAGFYREKFNITHIKELLSSLSYELEQDSSRVDIFYKFLTDSKLSGFNNILTLLKN